MTDALKAVNRTISDPITGEEIEPTDVDALAEAFARATKFSREVSTFVRLVKAAFGDLAKGDARTQRVNGERHRVQVVLPYSRWDQRRLAELWEEHPLLSARYLKEKVEVTYQPLLKEIGKLRNESGPGPFMLFREELLACEQEPTDAPTVKVETPTVDELEDQQREIASAIAHSLTVR